MSMVNVDDFQKALETKRKELLLGTSNRDEIRLENAAEEFDRLQQRMDRAVAIHHLDREAKSLKSVEEAIDRIKSGAFGVCLRCDEDIPEKRLRAVPWASCCLTCQEHNSTVTQGR